MKEFNPRSYQAEHFRPKSCFLPPFHHIPVAIFFHRRNARIQKTYLAKVDQSAQKPRVGPISRPRRPPVPHLVFTGSERVPPEPLGWYLIFLTKEKEALPDLQTGRYTHGCGSYRDSEGNTVCGMNTLQTMAAYL